MKLLVTGASGFIGRHLIPVLLQQGHELRVLAREVARVKVFNWSQKVQIYEGDLNNKASLLTACEQCEGIIHLAALAHVNNSSEMAHQQSSVEGTQLLLEAAMATSVSRFLFVSSIKASHDAHASAYARAKAEAEDLVRRVQQDNKIETFIVRPAIVYGAGMGGNLPAWIAKLIQGKVPGLPKRTSQLQMISVNDLCRGLALLCGQPQWSGQTATLHDGQLYGLSELEGLIRRACGREGAMLRLPRCVWWLASKGADAVFALSGRSPGFSSHSYATLFVQDELADDSFGQLTGFVAEDRLNDALPAIMDSIKAS